MSAASTSASGASFSSVSDIFPTTDAFKRTVYQASLEHGVGTVLHLGGPHRARMGCRIRADSTLISTGVGALCSFVVAGRKSRSSANPLRVAEVNLVHSCDPSLRTARASIARTRIEGKLRELSGPADHDGEGASVTAESSSSAEDGDDDGDERAAGGHAGRDSMLSPPQKRRCKSSLFPSAMELANEVDRLIERSGGTVPLPSARDTFDTPDEFIAQCRASAQTHGFSVGRRKSRAGWLQLRCFRSHSRYSSAPGGACSFRLEGEEGDDGLWRLSAQNLSHNHSLNSAPSLPAPDQAPALTPPVAPAPAPVVARVPAPPPSIAALPQLSPRATDEVAAFTHAAFPQLSSTDANSLVAFLRRAGIYTPAALAALPFSDVGILHHLDSDLKRADADDGWSVVELAQALKEGMGV